VAANRPISFELPQILRVELANLVVWRQSTEFLRLPLQIERDERHSSARGLSAFVIVIALLKVTKQKGAIFGRSRLRTGRSCAACRLL
jgi:hypothetical protein